ncbi:MAG: hypothetical protein IRY83_17230 [Chloroflexi bacterium]|nr:hypothetical protein [Chloroflexota bacterium]
MEDRLADLLQDQLAAREPSARARRRVRPGWLARRGRREADPALAEEAAALAALADDLRALPLPEPDPRRARAIRQQVLAALPEPRQGLSRRGLGRWVLAGAGALLAAAAVPAAARTAVLLTPTAPRPAVPSPPPRTAVPSPPAVRPAAVPGRLALSFRGIFLDDPSLLIAAGPDGQAWVVEPQARRISAVADGGAPQGWPLPTAGRAVSLAVDARGRPWLALEDPPALAVLDPADGRWQSWPLPTGSGDPGPLAVGPDGRVWLAAGPDRRLYAFDPARGALTAVGPAGTADLLWADGRLWAAGPGGRISAVDAAGRLTTYAVPGDPTGLAWDGARLWYAAGARLGRLDPPSGAVETFPLARGRADRVAAADGAVWFIARGSAALGRFDPATGAVRLARLDPMVSELAGLAPGGGELWLAGRPQGVVIAVTAVS